MKNLQYNAVNVVRTIRTFEDNIQEISNRKRLKLLLSHLESFL